MRTRLVRNLKERDAHEHMDERSTGGGRLPVGVVALTTFGYATLAGADPVEDRRVEASPGTPPPGMERMHELMVTGNPGMQRMHELSLEGNPRMQRMHALMR